MAVLKAAQKEKRETEAAAAEEKEEAAEAKSGLEKPAALHLRQRECTSARRDSGSEMHRLVSDAGAQGGRQNFRSLPRRAAASRTDPL